ncbi:MAG: phosphatase PAP2 family protein [Bacteroidaceae bacterium]|nr:phosphatase PAP2 family protein [Bacteroidaceae bacterium]
MTELQGLIETDRLATLSINGSDSIFWDGVANLYTSVIVWIPLILTAILLLIRNVNPKRLLFVLFMVALTVLLCDQLASSVFKPVFQRLRPTRDPFMLDLVDTVNGYRGGLYGFFSSHAANSFGLASLFMWLVRDRWFSLSVGLWAIANSLIRTYLGVHFLGDILVGTIVGSLIGSLTYWLFLLVSRKDREHLAVHSSTLLYTKSGFMRSDVFVFMCVLFGTCSLIMIGSCIMQGIQYL